MPTLIKKTYGDGKSLKSTLTKNKNGSYAVKVYSKVNPTKTYKLIDQKTKIMTLKSAKQRFKKVEKTF